MPLRQLLPEVVGCCYAQSESEALFVRRKSSCRAPLLF